MKNLAPKQNCAKAEPVLDLRKISYLVGNQPLLNNIDLQFAPGDFAAIVGPSGCGKTTLLRLIAGLVEPEDGIILWSGRDLLTENDLHPSEMGYVPQFSVAYDALTVTESVECAIRLRVAGLNEEEYVEKLETLLRDTGLDLIADRRVSVLSGGQKRRLSLAMEMVTSPRLLLCDEVLSGLDPKSEREIVELLHRFSEGTDRIIINVTHSLKHLDLYDSICVLTGGHVAYQGSPEHMAHYFDVQDNEEVFERLSRRLPEKWSRSWGKHREAFKPELALPETGEGNLSKPEHEPPETPGGWSQFRTLTARRWKIWSRDTSHLALQAALLFGFPCLVVLFALQGLPEIQNLDARLESNVVKQLAEANAYIKQATHDGSLVSGLVMFQVVLLTLMGSNNGAREIAGERSILEKEKLAGLHPSAYLASKILLLGTLVVVQSAWMAAFVSVVCHIPGSLASQVLLLILVNAAVTAISLALSANLRTAEQASLAAIYFVGFQLPLSGAFLALPEAIGSFVRPFIAAYWGWSGYLQSLRETNYFLVLQSVTQTALSGMPACIWFLTSQILAGIVIAWIGCRRSQWK